jgi:hypothetical protein
MSYRSEFAQVEATSFWSAYSGELESAKKSLIGLLSKGDISVMVSQGKAWQEALRVVERMINLPWSLMEKE